MNWGREWAVLVGAGWDGEVFGCVGSCLRRNDGGGAGMTEGAQE